MKRTLGENLAHVALVHLPGRDRALSQPRSLAASLSDPRDAMVIRQYASELEQLARPGRGGSRPGY